MERSSAAEAVPFAYSRTQWLVVAGVSAAVLLMFRNTFAYLYDMWQREEYSHGFLVPLVSLYLLWQRRQQLSRIDFRNSWAGVALAILGLMIFFLGALASITTVDTYALVIVIAGVALALMGWRAFKVALVPIALLFLMNPIPNFFYNNLSAALQLVSSRIGVAVIRLLGVSVFLEGNVIDLGTYKLQVAEACSGLRYLFPLMTLGVIVGYLFKARPWMRWCVFLSTVPITVLMNSFRIGVIGVLVDHFGIAQAEGFLHDFEGWVVFMACFALLFAECWLLLRLHGDRRSLRSAFALEPPAATPTGTGVRPRRLGIPAFATLLVLLAAVYPAHALPERAEIPPLRANFSEFPLQIGAWQGRRQSLEQVYLDALKLDDYVLADYVQAPEDRGLRTAVVGSAGVNLYVAYYLSQRTGQAAHSPRSCLPGGGWEMQGFGQYQVPGVRWGGVPLQVNRVVIQQGAERELVYYWFQERGRDLTNEYLVKWYLFADALARNRTDGAMVRLITPLAANESMAKADARLAEFAAASLPRLTSYVPD